MPFWLKWVALPIAGIVVAFWVIATIVHAILGSLVTLALVAVAAGALYWGYNKVMMEIPAYRRKKLRDKQRKGLYDRGSVRRPERRNPAGDLARSTCPVRL